MVTYRANCHCGKFVFEATSPEPVTKGAMCNCSICAKKGYIFAFLPEGGELKIVKGKMEEMSSYRAGPKYEHKFCPTCGSGVVITSIETGESVLNFRCVQGPPNLWTMPVSHFDGASIPPVYEEPAYTGPEPTGGPATDAHIYHGSCHCGAVRYALRCQDLTKLDGDKEEDLVVDCNCSNCMRAAFLWFYALADQVVYQNRDHLVEYQFGAYIDKKLFCKTCGVQMGKTPSTWTEAELATLPSLARDEDKRAWRARVQGKSPVNLRTLNGMGRGWDPEKTLPVKQLDGYNIVKPGYVNP